MDVIPLPYIIKKIKYSLVFFCFLSVLGCQKKAAPVTAQVNWANEKAVSATFTYKGPSSGVGVYVAGSEQAVMGSLSSKNGVYTFIPVVPFAGGRDYQIRQGTRTVGEFRIGKTGNGRPKLLAIYPSTDTVPENLLKIYLHFSEPMQQVGNALNFISVTHEEENREVPVFLELQSELWNADHSRLTLWLDPGRIKTHLIPNREKGLPIREGNTYTIRIAENWKNAQGIQLGGATVKTLYVTRRDMESPKPEHWSVHTPGRTTLDPLTLNFKEPLDAILALEAFRVYSSEAQEVAGVYKLEDQERTLHFFPKEPWPEGRYSLIVESRLEDLAGNNLNHLFDSDLTSAPNKGVPVKRKQVLFDVQ